MISSKKFYLIAALCWWLIIAAGSYAIPAGYALGLPYLVWWWLLGIVAFQLILYPGVKEDDD